MRHLKLIPLALRCGLLLMMPGPGAADHPGHDLTPVRLEDLVTAEIRELSLEAIREQGELIVITRNAPTIFYEDRDGRLAGPEHDLVASFAKYLGVEPRFRVLDSPREVLDAMRAGGPHLAAAGLTRTRLREEEFLFGPDYRVVRQELVCHREGAKPKTVEDLTGLKIAVISDSSYADTLYELGQRLPQLEWESLDDVATEELLEQVWERGLDCTLANSNIVAINRRYYPDLVIPFAMSDEQALGWIVAERAKALLPALKAWFAQAKKSGELDAIDVRYYAFAQEFDYVDVSTFIRRIDLRLPEYRGLFKEAGDENGFPWTLLAAMAYQESHWNPKARSPTGVRGMMMLTQAAASEVGVSNRLDPVQSIDGGALYLQQTLERIPDSVQGEDRLWMAMAAYNVGLGHLYDARELARRLGRNPDLWRDIREVLPLLSKKRYYRTVRHGYCRGGEPVRYVQRIRDYHDILKQQMTMAEEELAAH